MPHSVLIIRPGQTTKGMPRTYSQYKADQTADKLEISSEVEYTNAVDPVREKIELKEKLIQKDGFEKGSQRISKPVATVEELDEY